MAADPSQLKPITPAVAPDEAAAIVAAIELFMRATSPSPAPLPEATDPWLRAAILEGVERAREDDVRDPWINT
jgi:hypothetical protein